MMSNAFALALITTTGFMIVYKKLPGRLRRIIERHSLWADLGALVLVYLLLGGTLTALMAGALTGIFASILLHVANHKEDFLFLYDFRDMATAVYRDALGYVRKWGAEYTKSHPQSLEKHKEREKAAEEARKAKKAKKTAPEPVAA
jgi:hypothetical protein